MKKGGICLKTIPLIPCIDKNKLISFYKHIGFNLLYFSPTYFILGYKEIELHFYSSRKLLPEENATMCYIKVDNIDDIYNDFINNLKDATNRIPRTGFPKITKIRELADDMRFTLTDPSGNTFYIGSILVDNFFRIIENEEYKKDYILLYDLLYSKEDPQVAFNYIQKFGERFNILEGKDKAKFIIIEQHINLLLNKKVEIRMLFDYINKRNTDADWEKLKKKAESIFL